MLCGFVQDVAVGARGAVVGEQNKGVFKILLGGGEIHGGG